MSELALGAQVLAQVLSAVTPDQERPQAAFAHTILGALAASEIPLLLVDSDLTVRFYTRAAAALLQLPLRDGAPQRLAQPVASDRMLASDVKSAQHERRTLERDLRTSDGHCYLRRVMPLRDGLGGALVVFTDITEHDRAARDSRIAKQHAEHASAANLRRLSAVCHDLRQPMHTIGLLGGLLAQSFKDPLGQRLAAQLDQALHAMSGMLSSLQYGCKIGAGAIRPELTEFPIEEVFSRLRREFAYHAGAQRTKLRIPSCRRLAVRTDPALFEQMLRSLLEDAMTASGRKIVLGCRRRKESVRIELWCTPASSDRAPSGMLGGPGMTLPSGPDVAKKLADLLGYRLRSPAQDGHGPAHAIDLPEAPRAAAGAAVLPATAADDDAVKQSTIFVIDDDGETCAALQQILQQRGWAVETYSSAEDFLGSYAPRNPCCLLVDAHLTGMQGVELIEQLNANGSRLPSVVISGKGDIALAVQAMKAGALDFVEKPVSHSDLVAAVERALTLSRQLCREREERQQVLARLARLTARQKQVMRFMLDGKSSKAIAAHLFMSQRTVESHRANVMKKMGTRSLPELARMVAVAEADLH